MRNKFFFFIIVLFFIFGLGRLAQAHNPRLVYSLDALADKPITINNPDISQAFYGRLKGWEEYYQFTLDKSADFYWQTLVPDIQGITKNISADIIEPASGKIIAALDAKQSTWSPYYEEFAGDHYFSGPTSTINLAPGTYIIKIYNDNNEGKYVLVVGQKEYFSPQEIFGTIVNLPALKTYFNKSPLTAYFNYVGLFIVGALIIFFLLIFILRRLFRLFSRR